MQTDRWEITD